MQDSHVPTAIVGKPFDCVFGAFVPRLTYRSDTELRVQASIGGTEIDQVVSVGITMVGPDVILVSWTEKNGNFVVQVHALPQRIVHNVARLADGQLFRGEGSIRPVTV